MKTTGKYILFLLCAALLFSLVLSGCGKNAEPDTPENTDTAAVPRNVINVSDVDGLLYAIGSNTEVHLAPGRYDLSKASDYGKRVTGASYSWEQSYEGWQLDISGVHNFAITGDSAEQVEICTPDAYSYVLSFDNVSDLTLSGFTAGHVTMPGYCGADVIRVSMSENILIEGCDMYGCGVRAVFVTDSSSVNINDSILRDCSAGAVAAISDRDVRIRNCEITRCGTNGTDCPVVDAMYSDGVAVLDCTITANSGGQLVYAYGAREVYLLGCEVRENRITAGMFATGANSVTVDGCRFIDNNSAAWYDLRYSESPVVGSDGNELKGSDFLSMELAPSVYDGPVPAPAVQPVQPVKQEYSGDLEEYTVSTVDEFLAAIGSCRKIILNPGLYDLAAAQTYGRDVDAGYHWEEVYDGWQLVLSNLEHLEITASEPKQTTVSAIPRYADVMEFRECNDVSISCIEFGHTVEPGYCAGGVLNFSMCADISVDNCILYGCGVLGIMADNSKCITVSATEIHHCSYGAVQLLLCDYVTFEKMDIHDCELPDLRIDDCTEVYYEGLILQDGEHSFYGAVG